MSSDISPVDVHVMPVGLKVNHDHMTCTVTLPVLAISAFWAEVALENRTGREVVRPEFEPRIMTAKETARRWSSSEYMNYRQVAHVFVRPRRKLALHGILASDWGLDR